MSYVSASVVVGNSPATDFMTIIKNRITAHPAWTFIEQVVSGTNVADVYRCNVAYNGVADFYVIVTRNSVSGSQINIAVAEGYSTGTHLASKYAAFAPTGTAPTTALNADGTTTSTANPATQTWLTANTQGFIMGGTGFQSDSFSAPSANKGLQAIPTLSTLPYIIIVTNDHLVVVQRPTQGTITTSSLYAGLFDSFNTLAVDPLPLYSGRASWMWGSGTSSWLGSTQLNPGGSYPIAGSFTREPGLTVVANNMFHAWVWPWNYPSINGPGSTNGKDPINGRYYPSRLAVGSIRVGAQGAVRGLLKPTILCFSMGDVPVAWGDTITIDGVDFQCYVPRNDYNGAANQPSDLCMFISTAA